MGVTDDLDEPHDLDDGGALEQGPEVFRER